MTEHGAHDSEAVYSEGKIRQYEPFYQEEGRYKKVNVRISYQYLL